MRDDQVYAGSREMAITGSNKKIPASSLEYQTFNL